MDLLQIAERLLNDIQIYLKEIDRLSYTEPMEKMEGSSIGQHTRHVLEFYQCFFSQNSKGNLIDYNDRQFNRELQEEPLMAYDFAESLKKHLDNVQVNNKLKLKVNYFLNDENNYITVDTWFERELVFLIDHSIHHMAIIKTGLKLVNPELNLPEKFGVIPSFLKFRTQEK